MQTNGTIVCPACERGALKLEAGVCPRCRAAFEKSHRVGVNGTAHRALVTLETPHFADAAHSGFVAPGEPVPVVDFAWNEVESLAGEIRDTAPDAQAVAAELLARVFTYCFTKHKGNGNELPVPLRTAALRFAVVVASLRPDLVGRTLEGIADEVGMTKASASHAALMFADSWGMKLAPSRSATGRAHMARAMKASWQARHAAQTSPAIE